MKTILTLFFCCLSAGLLAQISSIHGSITHAQSGKPVEFVNIYAPGNNTGAVSDADGNFTINLAVFPDTLVVSFVGFATLRLPLESKPDHKLAISLQPQTGLLPEVAVSALKKAEVIYPATYSVVDYELYQGLPLLLVCKNSLSGYWLVALDEHDQVRGEIKLRHLHPESLVKSCLGGIYLLLENGAYRIEVAEGIPLLAENIGLQQYRRLILPCVAANENYLYLSRWRSKNQILSFEGAPRKGGAHLPIRTVLDESQLKRLQEEQWFRKVQTENAALLHGSMTPQMLANLIEHLTEDENIFADRFVYTPVKADLFVQGERLYLFNHTNDCIEWMAPEGEPLRRIPIQYHRDKKWKSEILHDAVTGHFYTLMEHGKNTLVLEINTHDGTTSEFMLLDKPFIQKVRIEDGKLYFLYKDFAFTDRNQRLHRAG